MPHGVTALPISEGLSRGYIPVSLPNMQVLQYDHHVTLGILNNMY